MNTTRWFAFAILAVTLPFLSKAPIADEESYLFMAEAISENPLRPYDWWRNWQPWGSEASSTSFHFAHPPMHLWWMASVQSVASLGPLFRLCAGLPFWLLFAWGASRLAQATTRKASTALFLTLASPVVVLGLQDSMMIDLGLLAFSTAGIALYRDALQERGSLHRNKALASGVLLGAAACTKYPAVLLLVVLVLHLKRLEMLQRSTPIWIGFALLVVPVQGLLWIQYDAIHPLAALASISEIDRSPVVERGAGLLVRLGFALSPLIFFGVRSLNKLWPMAALVGVLSVATLGRGDLGPIGIGWLFFCSTAGALLLVRAATAIKTPKPQKKRLGDRDDGFLLGAWIWAVVLSIVLGHNHADSRYLLPIILPLALLLVRSASKESGGIRWTRASAVIWSAVALLTAVADQRLANASESLVSDLSKTHRPARFSGEWTVRHSLESKGWVFWHPSEPLSPGDRVLLFSNGGSASPPERAKIIQTLSSPNHFPIRLLDWKADAGYHSEQLGRLPFAWGHGPLIEATLYEVLE